MPLHRLCVESLAISRIRFACTALPALLMLAALSQPGAAQTWTTLPGAAVDIGANPSGVVWVIGTGSVPGGYQIFRWNNGSWQNIPGGAVRVSVDPDGTAWIVNNTHTIFHSNANGQWTTVPGGATDIAVGGNGAVWIIGANGIDIDYAVFAPGTRTVTGWKQAPGGASRIAVDPNGNAWVVNSAGNIFQWQGSSWAQISGGARDVAVGADGTAYVVGNGPNVGGGSAVFQYQGNNSWKQLSVGATNVAAGPAGAIYVTQDSSKQYAILSWVAVVAASPAAQDSSTATGFTDFCWRNTHGRGAGTPLSTNSSDCPAGTVKDPAGLLCYPPCKAGYEMKGPLCRHVCPPGWSGDEVSCFKPKGYDRSGQTYPVHALEFDNKGMFSRCEADHGRGDCEELGAIVYPKCNKGYHPRDSDAFACDPDGNQCPAGMLDSVAMCTRDSYPNTAGQVLGCSPGTEKSGLLCYPSCGKNSDGVGPECWDQCPANWVQCGMGCAKDNKACATATTDQIVSVLSAAATIASEVLTAGAAAGIKEGATAVDKLGIKTGDEITKVSKATDAATDMVSKLKLSQAVKNFPLKGVDKATMAEVVARTTLKPTKLTMATKAPDVAGDAATLINNLIGISNDSGLTEDQKNFQIAQTVLQTSSLVDPTGIMGVVAAYTKPLCSLVTETASDSPVDLDKADQAEFRQSFASNY